MYHHGMAKALAKVVILCLVAAGAAFAFVGSAHADSIEVDVQKTKKDAIKRYCFQVTNDALGGEDAHDNDVKIYSFYVRWRSSECGNKKYRKSIDTPAGWGNKGAALGGRDCESWTKWVTTANGDPIAPGGEAGPFCVTLEGDIEFVRIYTDFFSKKITDDLQPNPGGITDDTNDDDFVTDTDGDTIGDPWDDAPNDADADDDGANDGDDNCPAVPNAGQSDSDGDDLGDDCDAAPANPDADSDGLDDGLEVLLLGSFPNDSDSDDDLVDDKDEFDADSDLMNSSSTPEILGDSIDNDLDGLVDENFDMDFDWWEDLDDNCPYVANFDQLDTDSDGIGDACAAPVGGIAEYPNVDASPAATADSSGGSSSPPYAAIAGAAAAAAAALVAGGWYARRRWMR